MDQNLLKIRCIHCGAKLTIRNMPNIDNLPVECPNCHEKFKVCEGLQSFKAGASQSSGEETQYPNSGGKDNEETTILSSGLNTIGQLVEMSTGKIHALRLGRNTIGRTSSTSTATITIDDPSRRMSRQHAIIEVRTMPNGAFRHFLSNWNNKDATIVGNEQLMPGESIVLQDGQIVKFGSSALRFVIPDEEKTEY